MNLPGLFKIYLKTQNVSPVTIKNYSVDVNHFFNWLAQKTGIRHEVAGNSIFGLFTQETINEYKTDLKSTKTPPSTINRRLSSLRKLGQFAKSQGWISLRQTPNGQLVEKILENFRKHLEKEQVSRITIKNYLADLRDFLAWVETI